MPARRARLARMAVAAVALAAAAGCTAGRNAAPPPSSAPVPVPVPAPPPPSAPPSALGRPWGDAVRGVLTFRGNPTRTYYGEGPVPRAPEVAWTFPEQGGMCGTSTVGRETKQWCGTGWTGQPAVFEREGLTWVVFGAYDKAVHFLNAATGERVLDDFPVGDIIKGSVTADPDGFPLVYTGSRDDYYRVIAIDRDEPVELWRLSATAVSPTLWNDDWDGSGLVVDDHLVEGGENGQFHVVKLNRSYGPDGLVTVAPELVFNAPGWDAELLADLPDRNVSIEGSVAVHDGVAYFANSGGLVQGWDLSGLSDGATPERVFRFWMGDDTDASIVVDDEGMLYAAAEFDRATARAAEVGQLVKLDPRRPESPVVWALKDQGPPPQGFWATPALHRDLLVVPTNGGRLLGVDRATGAVRWEKRLPGPTWQSPVVVDDVLLQGDCDGVLHAYDVSDTAVEPPELWSLPIGGCVESTPTVWGGRVFVGTRAGSFLALADRVPAG